MRKKQAANVKLQFDPTMPTGEIEIDGTRYRMCFDFAALAQAEGELQAKGIPVNILASIKLNSISSVQTLFAASLRRYQPDLDWFDALKLVTWQTYAAIAPAVAYALSEAMAPPKPDAPKPAETGEADPQQP